MSAGAADIDGGTLTRVEASSPAAVGNFSNPPVPPGPMPARRPCDLSGELGVRCPGKDDPLPAAGYSELLGQIAAEDRGTRLRALRAANAEVIALNWRIGRLILRRQAQEGWGARVITLLSHRAQ